MPSLRTLLNRFAWGISGLPFLAACFGCQSQTDSGGASSAVQTQQVAAADREFAIEGMTCDGCVNTLTAALSRLPGVQSAKVSLPDKKAIVVADPAEVPTEKIVEAVAAAGYQAQPLAAESPPSGT